MFLVTLMVLEAGRLSRILIHVHFLVDLRFWTFPRHGKRFVHGRAREAFVLPKGLQVSDNLGRHVTWERVVHTIVVVCWGCAKNASAIDQACCDAVVPRS